MVDGKSLTPFFSFFLYGTPAKNKKIRKSAEEAGLDTKKSPVQHIVNSGDFVGNILGRNAGGFKETSISTIKAPLLFISPLSPHSNYYCKGSFCNFNQTNKLGDLK